MTTLTPRGRRLARERELDPTARHGRAMDVARLVDAWGLPHNRQRLTNHELSARFDRFERAHVTTLADVWRQGQPEELDK